MNKTFLVLAYSTLFSFGLIDNARGPAYPEILASFDLSPNQGAPVFWLATLAGLVVNLASKWWLARWGAVFSTKLSLLFMAVGIFLMGHSVNLGSPVFWLYLGSVIFGMGSSFSGVSMNILVSEGTTHEVRGRAFAGLHSTYGIASLCSPLLLAYFLKHIPYWNKFFMLLSIVPIIIFGLSFFLSKKELFPREKGTLKPPIKLNKRMLYGFLFGFYVASEIAISSRLPLYFENIVGWSPSTAKQGLSLFFLSLTLGRISFTFIKTGEKRIYFLLGSLLGTIVLFFIGYYYWPWALALTGLSMSMFFPVGMDWLAQRFERGREFMMASVLTYIALSLIFMHVVFGWINANLGAREAILIVPVLSLISLVLLLSLKKARESITS
ncbi:MAG: MFS transporter [Halobacteriovoraceae bacterium]|nr:MFS transporter [Halobacteriovoraceae bacterium]MBT5093004.1 MFS transporter [Halobacteriovoraceae bacterium]